MLTEMPAQGVEDDSTLCLGESHIRKSLISVASISKLLDGCSSLQQEIGKICRLMSTNSFLLPSAPSIEKLFYSILIRVCLAE